VNDDTGLTAQVPTTFEVRSGYLDQAVIGYLIYGVGAVTAFLAVVLSLSDAQAALHSSALAVGFVVAGLVGDRLDALLGVRLVHVVAYLGLSAAIIGLVLAPAFVVTLASAFAVGLGSALILAHINRVLTSAGGTLARVRMGRATFVSMIASLCVPLVIGFGVDQGLGWQVVALPAAVLLAIGIVAAGRQSDRARQVRPTKARLPSVYWLAWTLLVLVVSVEFAIVFWASSLIERQVGIPLGDATLIVSGFYAGMALARVMLSSHAVGRLDPVWLMRGGIAVAMVGTLLAWLARSVEPAAVGIFLGGLGVGFQYPLGAAVALSMAPGQERQASSRLVMASGLAILLSPLALGVAADLVGVSTAWLLIPGLCVAAIALSVPVARARQHSAT
jgi:MFS family permease